MGIDDLIRQARERQARQDAAFEAAVALPKEELPGLVARLLAFMEAGERTKPVAVAVASPNKFLGTFSSSGATKSFTEKADAYLEEHPEGASTAQVALAIGQSAASADGTLRALMKKGRALRRGHLWYPASVAEEPPVPAPKRMTLRDYILAVFHAEKKPLGSLAIYEGLQKLKPDVNRGSSDGEVVRMRKEGLLQVVGTGPNNGGLFVPVGTDGQPLFREGTV